MNIEYLANVPYHIFRAEWGYEQSSARRYEMLIYVGEGSWKSALSIQIHRTTMVYSEEKINNSIDNS